MVVGEINWGYAVVVQILSEVVYVWELGQSKVLGILSEGGQAVGGALDQHGDRVREKTAGLAQKEIVHDKTKPSEVLEVFQESFLLISIE